MFPDLYPYNVAPALSTTTLRQSLELKYYPHQNPTSSPPPPTHPQNLFLKERLFHGPWDLCQTQQSYSIPLGVCRCVQFFLKQFFIFWVRVG